MKIYRRSEVELGVRTERRQGIEVRVVSALVTIETDDEGIHDWIISKLQEIDADLV